MHSSVNMCFDSQHFNVGPKFSPKMASHCLTTTPQCRRKFRDEGWFKLTRSITYK